MIKTKLLEVGQKIHCLSKTGYIVNIEGEQKPETVRSVLQGVGVAGGNATINVVFEDHFSSLPESLVRGSVQWKIFEEIISETELAEKIKHAQTCIIAKQEQADKAKNAKQAEELRQESAPEYKHLKPCEKYNTTDTAKNIRAHLKELFPNTKFSVRKEHHSSVGVTWTDGVFKHEVEKALVFFKWITGCRMDDSAEYSNHPWIFGTVSYLSVRRDHSDEALQVAIVKINARFKLTGTVEQYRNGNLPPLSEDGNWNGYAQELWKVLEGEVDYELEDKRWERRKEIEGLLKNERGHELYKGLVYAWEHEGEWIVKSNGGYDVPEFHYKDEYNHSAKIIAAMLDREVKKMIPKVEAFVRRCRNNHHFC